jgi:hypothetical protein
VGAVAAAFLVSMSKQIVTLEETVRERVLRLTHNPTLSLIG